MIVNTGINRMKSGILQLLPDFLGSSRKVRERDRKESDERKEEMVITVAISQALGNFNLVVEALKSTC